ncbi:hypothetical protein ABZZ80_31260 [Streptomyces sp. NPDC006356]
MRQSGPTIGPEAFLAPEHKVVLAGDTEEARAAARAKQHLDAAGGVVAMRRSSAERGTHQSSRYGTEQFTAILN